MSDSRKSVLAALGVASSIAAIGFGFKVRQNADLGPLAAVNSQASADASSDASMGHLMASRTNDVNVPAGTFFYDLSQALKKEYVEPVTDDQMLASGAIRGMVSSLDDPESVYMDKTEFPAFLNARVGKFEGIGVDVALVKTGSHSPLKAGTRPSEAEMSPEDAMVVVKEIGRLEVVSVVPGGPADRAGVKVGDAVYSVDDHWVVNSNLINKFRIALKRFNEKKMPLSELNVLRNEIRTKSERAIFPSRAKDRLILGKSGSVTVVWDRNGTQVKTKIQKTSSSMPGFTDKDGTILLPFVEGSSSKLISAIKGKESVTIDLRNNTLGDLQAMRQCLSDVAPSGQYGYFVTHRHDQPTPLTVLKGNSNPPKLKLLVDKSTRGAAEVFALALSAKKLATLSQSEMGGDLDSKQITELPDNSGYTLVTSTFKTSVPKSIVAKRGATK